MAIGLSIKDVHTRKTSLMRETNQEYGDFMAKLASFSPPRSRRRQKKAMLSECGSRHSGLITLFLFTAYGIFS